MVIGLTDRDASMFERCGCISNFDVRSLARIDTKVELCSDPLRGLVLERIGSHRTYIDLPSKGQCLVDLDVF